MSVQTFEAITDDDGNIRLTDPVRLPGRTKVYIVVPEQTTPYHKLRQKPRITSAMRVSSRSRHGRRID